jgi:hypothetical protein
MRQWAVDLSGEGYRSGSSRTHTCTLIGRSTSSSEECVFCFMSALAARIDGCCPCSVTATMR